MKHHAIAPSNAMIRKAHESWLYTLLCEKEIERTRKTYLADKRGIFGWRAGFLVLTS